MKRLSLLTVYAAGKSADRRLGCAFLVQCRKRSVVDAVDGGIERVVDAGLVCENTLDLSHPGDVAATDESRCNLQAAVQNVHAGGVVQVETRVADGHRRRIVVRDGVGLDDDAPGMCGEAERGTEQPD